MGFNSGFKGLMFITSRIFKSLIEFYSKKSIFWRYNIASNNQHYLHRYEIKVSETSARL